jgi:hypothetical protein
VVAQGCVARPHRQEHELSGFARTKDAKPLARGLLSARRGKFLQECRQFGLPAGEAVDLGKQQSRVTGIPGDLHPRQSRGAWTMGSNARGSLPTSLVTVPPDVGPRLTPR